MVMGIALRGCRHPPRRIMSSVRIQKSLPKADHQRVNDDCAIFTLEIRMCLHPSVGLDYLFWKRGSGKDLRHQRIGIQRDRRHQLLQLLGSFRCVFRASWCRRWCLLVLRQHRRLWQGSEDQRKRQETP